MGGLSMTLSVIIGVIVIIGFAILARFIVNHYAEEKK